MKGKIKELKESYSKFFVEVRSGVVYGFSKDEVEDMEFLFNTIEQLQKEKEELRLEVCRLYDKYCQ
ncbi:hypothetical protein [Litchfieldia alkalitelluris]|uniref:hypothetical protein n=1 Tax=Litchfieldia alkalitelluris TaxID=304268 RepID=UPI000996AD88|nr:hypothetical protein [Litchfieldia alkalitelluris]